MTRLGGLGLVIAALLALPASAGAATIFGADMSQTPAFSSYIYSITNVVKSDGSEDTGAPVSGILVSVRVRTAGAAGNGVIRVLRQTSHPDASTYGLLNTDPEIPISVTADGTVPGHVTEVLTRRPIFAGDRLGWYINDPGSATFEQAAPGAPTQCAFAAGSAWTVGTSRDHQTVGCNNLPVLLSGTIEADADGDGFGDETQDQCPTNAAIQTACPTGVPLPGTAPKKKCKKKHRSADASVAKKKCKKKHR